MFKSISLLALAGTALSAAIAARDTTCIPIPIFLNGRACTIECGTDHVGGNYGALYTQNFAACINACTSDTKCATAQYLTTNSYCYLKSMVNPGSSNANVNSVNCANQLIACIPGLVLLDGRVGYVECGIDHPGGDYAAQPAASLQACENLCAADPKCQTAQYSSSSEYCYMKSAVNPGVANANVNGVVFPSASSTVSSSTTAPSPTAKTIF